jgi:hypothetical protein
MAGHYTGSEKFFVVLCDPKLDEMELIKRFDRLEDARTLSKELNLALNDAEGIPEHAPFPFYMVECHPSVSVVDGYAVTHACRETAPDFARTLLHSRDLASVRSIRRRGFNGRDSVRRVAQN